MYCLPKHLEVSDPKTKEEGSNQHYFFLIPKIKNVDMPDTSDHNELFQTSLCPHQQRELDLNFVRNIEQLSQISTKLREPARLFLHSVGWHLQWHCLCVVVAISARTSKICHTQTAHILFVFIFLFTSTDTFTPQEAPVPRTRSCCYTTINEVPAEAISNKTSAVNENL
jgi:hypothetical protein